MWWFYSICAKPVEIIWKFWPLSDWLLLTLFHWLVRPLMGGNRAEWARISMHEPHYTWSHWLGFGLLIYLFLDSLLQRYKLALISCGDISQQLEASCPPVCSLFFPRETVEGSLHLLPKYRFCQRTTPARDKDISLKERTDSSASFRSIEWLIVAKSFISPELARRH